MSSVLVEDSEGRRARLDRRLHDSAWGLLLILTGVVWLVPGETVPPGTWLLGVAAILFGVNAVRHLAHIGVNVFSLVLGAMALIAAVGQVWRADLPLFAIFLIVIGLSLVAGPFLTKGQQR